MPGSCTTIDLGAFNGTREAVRTDPEVGKGAFVAVTH